MVHLKLATPVFFEMSEGPVFIFVEGGGKKYVQDNNILSFPPPLHPPGHVNSK